VRVGIIGTESSHVDHIVDYLNVTQARPGIRVTALAGGDEDRARQLCQAGGIDLVVPDVPALLDVADVLIVTARHGGSHRGLAMPFIEKGRPVLVDKPFACRVADAAAMLDAAEQHQALVTSFSALRYLPATDALADQLAGMLPVRSVIATGPADPASEYGGIFFYGIHPVDVALRLAPGPLGPVRVDRAGESIVASAMAGDARVTINLIKPGPDGTVPFHALAVARGGIAGGELPVGGNYVAYGLAAFLDMIEGTVPPLTRDELLRPIAFLEAVDDALR
jgi:predicted dehydrogenase